VGLHGFNPVAAELLPQRKIFFSDQYVILKTIFIHIVYIKSAVARVGASFSHKSAVSRVRLCYNPLAVLQLPLLL
jgi:hypothetical protein